MAEKLRKLAHLPDNRKHKDTITWEQGKKFNQEDANDGIKQANKVERHLQDLCWLTEEVAGNGFRHDTQQTRAMQRLNDMLEELKWFIGNHIHVMMHIHQGRTDLGTENGPHETPELIKMHQEIDQRIIKEIFDGCEKVFRVYSPKESGEK